MRPPVSLRGAAPQNENAPLIEEGGKITDVNTLNDSRGGTRTRDPGIMSAVL